MKRLFILFIVFIFGMTAFSQDMSYYTAEYNRPDSTFNERLIILETVRDAGTTGIGEFYHNALRVLLARSPDIKNLTERAEAERSVIILCQGLGAEKHIAAAWDVWQAAELFDVTGNVLDGLAMQSALEALGQMEARALIPNIVQRLDEFNAVNVRSADLRRRTQMAIVGCISALEALKDIRGYRPVFYTSIGQYDPDVKRLAANALPNIVNDPGEVIVEIIRDPRSEPQIKLTIWNEMLRTNMPDSSKAKVAAAALDVGWALQTSNRAFQGQMRELRKNAINLIIQVGAADETVLTNLERSYANNFSSNNPDFDEISAALHALSAIRSEESTEILFKFLREINTRRRTGPWGNKERRVYEWLIPCIGATRTQSAEIRNLLTTINRNVNVYTAHERALAANALAALGN
ncbi:MAG: hypothetical protein FWD28_03585 [Treponema sp.]|nr:hypothetical protein [Treponema sp.]